jgi:micrococcal nuclease
MTERTIAHEYTYMATVERVVDGDTIDLLVDLGFRTYQKLRVRLYGINIPETFGVKASMAVKDFVEEWLGTKPDPMTGLTTRCAICIRSHDGKDFGQEKYGRWLCEVVKRDGTGPTLNDALVEAGHAKRVDY